MNHLKDWAQKQQIFHLLTFADDQAIGYFERQGKMRGRKKGEGWGEG
jgi:hypothetical protein